MPCLSFSNGTACSVGSSLRGVDRVAVSPDNSRIAISFGFGQSGISILDLQSRDLKTVTRNDAQLVAFSPDGKRLCYVKSSRELTYVRM
jgi:Tol biopolymer transport system component